MRELLVQHVLLPALLPFSRSRYLRIGKSLRNAQWSPANNTANEQDQKLRDLIEFAAEEIPFYQERFIETGRSTAVIGSRGGISVLPVTTKEDVQANFPDRMIPSSGREDDWQYVGTRGTTNRVMVIQSFIKRDWVRAAEYVALTESTSHRIGRPMVYIPPDACNALCGLEGMREASVSGHLRKMLTNGELRDPKAVSDLRGLVMENWVKRSTILEPFGSDGTHIADERLAYYVDRLTEVRPSMLKALPEYLLQLARFLKRSGRHLPSIPVVRPMGANMNRCIKEEVADAFAADVREDYGCTELGPIGFECEVKNGIHVFENAFYVETLRNQQPVDDGELGRVVITDLVNRAMPLIRYQIGDVARMTSEPCSCGRRSRRIFLEGRIEDTIVSDSGKLLSAEKIGEFFYRFPGIDDYQLTEQRSDLWVLKFVASGNGPDTERLKSGLFELAGKEPTLRMQQVNSIAPEASGKFRHSKSNSYQHFCDKLAPVETV